MNGADAEITYSNLKARVNELRETISEIEHISNMVKRRLCGGTKMPGREVPDPATPAQGMLPELESEVNGMLSKCQRVITTMQEVNRRMDDGREIPHAN